MPGPVVPLCAGFAPAPRAAPWSHSRGGFSVTPLRAESGEGRAMPRALQPEIEPHALGMLRGVRRVVFAVLRLSSDSWFAGHVVTTY